MIGIECPVIHNHKEVEMGVRVMRNTRLMGSYGPKTQVSNIDICKACSQQMCLQEVSNSDVDDCKTFAGRGKLAQTLTLGRCAVRWPSRRCLRHSQQIDSVRQNNELHTLILLLNG